MDSHERAQYQAVIREMTELLQESYKVIDMLAEQQAMHDPFYEIVSKLIKEALAKHGRLEE